MAKAIHTRYIPATNTRQARIRATCRVDRNEAFTVIIPYSWSGNEHREGAEALRDKHFPGHSLMLAGLAVDGRGDVFTICPEAV